MSNFSIQKKELMEILFSSKFSPLLSSIKFVMVLFLTLTVTNCTNIETSSADTIRSEASSSNQNMYVIEREIPGAGDLTPDDLKGISQTSCGVLTKMGSEIQWLHSYVTGDKIYCVYTAPNEEMVREHANQGGFPANSVSLVSTVIDPSTAEY
jgi:hypothetical protein